MSLPEFDMRQLLEAGVHFGHQTHRWNPKMEPFIFGSRNGIHIVDLSQTVPYLHRALQEMREVVAKGGRVLFVGTKRQAADNIAEAAKRSGQYFVNHRWLGGMLTNWRTISNSIKRLKAMDEQLSQEELGLTKKEVLDLQRHRDKLELSLGGIRDMGGLPDIMFVIDTNREVHAVREANRLGIPVVGVVDTNSDPDGITYPIPGNDDATRAIKLYCDLAALSVLDGIQAELESHGVDVGASEEPTEEVLIEAAQARNEGADMAKAAGAEPVAKADKADAKAGEKTEGTSEEEAGEKVEAKAEAQPAAAKTEAAAPKAAPETKAEAEDSKKTAEPAEPATPDEAKAKKSASATTKATAEKKSATTKKATTSTAAKSKTSKKAATQSTGKKTAAKTATSKAKSATASKPKTESKAAKTSGSSASTGEKAAAKSESKTSKSGTKSTAKSSSSTAKKTAKPSSSAAKSGGTKKASASASSKSTSSKTSDKKSSSSSTTSGKAKSDKT